MARPANEPHGALQGLRVVDLTTMLAGPYCTMMLADQGADVIKVEPPGGDGTRGLGPYRSDDALRNFGGYFQSVNRNKRSLVLDLKRDPDRAVLRDLVRGADVLVENYRAGVMERFGLAYEQLRELNPRLVYACIRGFGDPRSGASPYLQWPAYDVVAQAMGGVMAITGARGGGPTKVGPGIGDTVPAMMAAFAVMAAVYRAQRTGEGQFVDLAMYDAMIALCERSVYQYAYEHVVAGPQGNEHPLLCPFGLFETRDGWVSIAAHQDGFWKALCRRIGRPELGEDPRYATNAARLARQDEVTALLEAWTRTRSKAEVAAALGGEVPVGPVNDAADIWRDPHVRVRRMLAEVEQPGSAEPVTIADTPIRMSKTPGGVRSRAPLLDEHRAEILNELGLGGQLQGDRS